MVRDGIAEQAFARAEPPAGASAKDGWSVLYPQAVSFDETRDATRRTRLANERTYLAWWRTGLTSIAVSIGLGRIVPGVSHVTRWPYEAVGAGFGLLGVTFIVLGYVRARSVERALARGEFPHLDDRIALALIVAGVLLGLA
jgi:putative membrane protein